MDFRSGQKRSTGVHYAASKLDLPNQHIYISTYISGRKIESDLKLEGPDALDFSIQSDDPAIPIIKGKFLNSDYHENIMTSSLPDKKINIQGSVTKIDESNFVSIKTLIDTTTGNTIAVVQELVEVISESQFNETRK